MTDMDWMNGRALSADADNTRDTTLEAWLQVCRQQSDFSVDEIPLNELREWNLDSIEGLLALRHDSGRFFSVEGLGVSSNFGPLQHWDQAIIRQPGRGLLGILARVHNGVLEFLLQAKMEPGCINGRQASPTIQASKSNYTQVHKGRVPAYFEYFADFEKNLWITRSPQVEQTTRFLGKKNINAVRLLKDSSRVPVGDYFRWASLAEIKSLYHVDNGMNMNARSVLACLPPLSGELCESVQTGSSFQDMLYLSLKTPFPNENYQSWVWFSEMQERFQVDFSLKSLDGLEGWHIDENGIHGPFFSIVGVCVQADREVANWDQPLVSQHENGLSAIVGRMINGSPCFLMQAKADVGGDPVVHIAPTVSCSAPSTRLGVDQAPYLLPYVLEKKDAVLDTVLSEEGGRFQKCRNRYMIIWDDDFPIDGHPGNYAWIPYSSLFEFIRHGHMNIEARSLFAYLV